jgi:hypothetical protein
MVLTVNNVNLLLFVLEMQNVFCLYLRGKSPSTRWIGVWVGPRAGLDAVEKRKILEPSRIEPGPSSQSLSRLMHLWIV